MKIKVNTVNLAGEYLVNYEYVPSEKDAILKSDGMTIADLSNEYNQNNFNSTNVFEVTSSCVQRYVYPTDFWLDNDCNSISHLTHRKEEHCEEKTNI